MVGANSWSVYNSWLNGFASGRQSVSADESYWGAVGLAYLAMVPTASILVVWMYRFWGQLRDLKPNTEQRWNRGWTIGAWFIPIGNLWIPKQIIDDFWTTTDPAHPGGIRPGVPPLLNWWWGTWLAGMILLQASGTMNPQQVSGWRTFYLASVLGTGLVAVSGALAAVLVGRLARRLDGMVTTRASGFNR